MTWAAPGPATFGVPNIGQTFTTTPGRAQAPTPPGLRQVPPTHEIGDVQGAGAASPLDGQVVAVEGLVVVDFQAAGQSGGVFL